MQDKELHFVARCAHCGKAKNVHRAFTLDCPAGKRTPTGYTTFGPQCFRLAGEPAAAPRPSREAKPHGVG